MGAIRATWVNGQILPVEPVDWPEGSELLVEPIPRSRKSMGIDESQWRDDAEAIADWDRWLQAIEPLEYTSEEQAAFAIFDEAFRRSNIESVRQQMAPGGEA